MQKLAEEFAPGGSIEKTYAADIEKEGKLLGAKLNASAVSRGLGNASIGIPTTVSKSVMGAKQKLRSETTSNYMAALQNLAQLALQQQQFGLQQQQVNAANNTPTGYTRSGTKLTDFGFGSNPTASSFSTNTPSASSLPSLYASGGYGGGASTDAYGALVAPLFGGTTSTESSEPEWDYSMLYGTSKTPSGGTVVY
jgi:type II secretory pathway pseudopilin PulG